MHSSSHLFLPPPPAPGLLTVLLRRGQEVPEEEQVVVVAPAPPVEAPAVAAAAAAAAAAALQQASPSCVTVLPMDDAGEGEEGEQKGTLEGLTDRAGRTVSKTFHGVVRDVGRGLGMLGFTKKGRGR